MTASKKAAAELRHFIERVERLIEEKKTIGDDMKAVFAEAKAAGFDPKTMRRIIKQRATDKAEFEEAEAQLDLYRVALGMAEELPLFAYFKAAGDPANAQPIADALGQVLPPGGEIILKAGGKPLRIWKTDAGKVRSEEWQPGVTMRDDAGEPAKKSRDGAVLKFGRKKPDLKLVDENPDAIADAMARSLEPVGEGEDLT